MSEDMTREEVIENFKEFIDHFRTQIKQAQAIGDKAFDVERAERDIQTFEMAIKVLENHDTFMKYAYSYGKADTLSQESNRDMEEIREKEKIEQEPCEDAISINSMVETIATKVTEDTEKFIFETITPYCEEITKREISKKDLERALTQYFSKEPCEDTISRADAINQMEQSYNILDATDRIKALPPVTPSRPKGHWIEEEDFDGDTSYKCSECNEVFGLFDGTPTDYLYNYCPNCGAEMESEE